MNKHLQGALIAFLVLVPWLIAANTNQWDKVVSTNLMTNVSTNTTGSVVNLPAGSKTIQGTLVCNAGGSTNCGITFTIYGSRLATQATGTKEQLCQVIIPTGAATTTGTCAPITGAFLSMWAETTGVAGTSPALTIDSMH